MNNVRIFCLVIFILASTLSVTHAESVDQIEDTKPYFPMVPGSVWRYSSQSGGSTTIAVESCTPDNEATSVCTFSEAYSSNLQQNYLRYVFRDNSLFLVEEKIQNHNWQIKNKMMLKSPLKVGDSWETIERSQVSKFKVVAILPSMRIWIGTFNNVVMIEREVVIPGRTRTIGYDYYAPNVGLIGIGGRPDPEVRLLKELTEFKIGVSESQKGNDSEQQNYGENR